MSENRRCGDCRYFDASGYCRFTAPSVVGWPTTTAADWCGEWTAPRTANQAGEWGVPPGLLHDVSAAAAPAKSQRRLI